MQALTSTTGKWSRTNDRMLAFQQMAKPSMLNKPHSRLQGRRRYSLRKLVLRSAAS
jgi:hypothetical protein